MALPVPVQRDNHFSRLAGHTVSDTDQDAFGLLVHMGTLMARVQTASVQID